jgi:hypothetical protein
VLIITGGLLLITSIRNYNKIPVIKEMSDTKMAVITRVSRRSKAFETTIYFQVQNEPQRHRVQLLLLFPKVVAPEPGQIIHVKDDENGELWIIDEYITEIYWNYYFRFGISIFLLINSVLCILGIISILKKM